MKKNIVFTLCWIFLLLCVPLRVSFAVQPLQKSFLEVLDTEENKALLSFYLSEDASFQTNLLDFLKSGGQVHLVYTISLHTPEWLWPTTFATHKLFKTAHYDHLHDEFVLGDDTFNQHFASEEGFVQALFLLPYVPLSLSRPIDAASRVALTVRLRFRAQDTVQGDMLDFLSLKRFWKTRELKQEMVLNVRD